MQLKLRVIDGPMKDSMIKVKANTYVNRTMQYSMLVFQFESTTFQLSDGTVLEITRSLDNPHELVLKDVTP